MNTDPPWNVDFQKVLFAVRRSVRYHNRRRQFFDRLDKFITSFTAIGGIGAVATLLDSAGSLTTLSYAAVAGIFSILALVFRCAESANLHRDLAQRFIQLEISMTKAGADPAPERIAEFQTERLRIELEEPPVLRVLDTLCNNELRRAMGYPKDEQVKLSFSQRFFADFFDWFPERIQCQGQQ